MSGGGGKSGICCSYAIAKKPAQNHIWFRSQQQQPVCVELGFTWKFQMKPNETEEPKSEVNFNIFFVFFKYHTRLYQMFTQKFLLQPVQILRSLLRRALKPPGCHCGQDCVVRILIDLFHQCNLNRSFRSPVIAEKHLERGLVKRRECHFLMTKAKHWR